MEILAISLVPTMFFLIVGCVENENSPNTLSYKNADGIIIAPIKKPLDKFKIISIILCITKRFV